MSGQGCLTSGIHTDVSAVMADWAVSAGDCVALSGFRATSSEVRAVLVDRAASTVVYVAFV